MSGVVKKNGDSSVTVQVDQWQERASDSRGIGGTIFSPLPIGQSGSSAMGDESIHGSTKDLAPEKRLTLFALRLAVLEKAATGLGALGFAWATIVLLGGFANILNKVDFWFITIILLIEGARIFSRSHELEWQHHSTWSPGNDSGYSIQGIKSTLIEHTRFRLSPRDRQNGSRNRVAVAGDRNNSQPENHGIHYNQLRRTWKSSEVSLLPYTGWVTLSKNISRLLYWLQLLSATACIVLSLMRLIKQDYDKNIVEADATRNMNSALNIFYGLALAESLLCWIEKVYWEWKVSFCDLLVEVNRACGFKDTEEDMVPITRFFYDAFSRCIDGSIFDGLKMDLVSYSEELLSSDSSDEQLTGARILLKFVTENKFVADTLRKIGTSTTTMERLVEMLNWKNPEEEELRMATAEIMLKLAGKKQNAHRVAEIPGSIVSISSLLHSGPLVKASKPHEISARRAVPDQQNYEFPAFNRLGLRILKKLAHDHENCSKIGYTRGLLQKVIDFTGNAESLLGQPHTADTLIKSMKYALLLVKMLASTPGQTGKDLRNEISENVFSISNIRDILQYGQNHTKLQKLAIEIITNLGMDDEATDRIGCTGGIIRELFGIFLAQGLTDNQNLVKVEAGEALMMLTMDSKANCERILRLEEVERLVEALSDPVLMKNSARILRNLYAYGGTENVHRLRVVTAATPTVLKTVMQEEKKLLEVSIGLATQILKFMSPEEATEEFKKAGINECRIAEKLVKILSNNKQPCIDFPRMRRFAIELAIWMMESNEKNKGIFRKEGLKEELVNVANTTSELEFFLVFSGSAGLSRHPKTMHSLVDETLEILGND